MSTDKALLTVDLVLRDTSASQWLRTALWSALDRDPVDAANDAEVLAQVLGDEADAHLAKALASAVDRDTVEGVEVWYRRKPYRRILEPAHPRPAHLMPEPWKDVHVTSEEDSRSGGV